MRPNRAGCLLTALSMWSATSSAAVFTVGPGGTHATVQAAVNAALVAAGDDEIRIVQGTRNERVVLLTADNDDHLDISGGWNAAFDAQTADPALTVLDGGDLGITMSLEVNQGTVTVGNLSLTGGRSTFLGGNLAVLARGEALVEIGDCVLFGGEVLAGTGFSGYGAGAALAAYNDSLVSMERCEVRGNLIETVNAGGWGAGVYLSASQDATVRLSEVDVHDNEVDGLYALGAGVTAELLLQGRAQIFDSSISDNLAIGTTETSVASGMYLNLHGTPYATRVEFRRNRVLRNTSQGAQPTVQVKVQGGGDSNLVMSDSLIAGSARDGGLALNRSENAAMLLNNLTVADNAGIDLDAGAGVNVSNTLADSVGAQIGSATVVRSRFGGEPGYVDRAGGDYHLLPDAPAVNAGTLSPLGGLGEFDLDGNPRARGHHVDQGAYEAEHPRLFIDGFDDPQ